MKNSISLPISLIFGLFLLLAASGCSLHDSQISFQQGVQNHAAAARMFERVRHDPVRLRSFLFRFPKGGELHSHLSGAIYAEDFLRWSIAENLCISPQTMKFRFPPCSGDTPPADKALQDTDLWNGFVDYFSNRNFNSSRAMWGHDHFFSTFSHFDLIAHLSAGKMLAQAMIEAGENHCLYLELMKSFFPDQLKEIAEKVGWNGNVRATLQGLKQAGLFETIPDVRKKIDAVEEEAEKIVKGTPGQNVTVRWLNQCIRVFPPEIVFAHLAYSFALCEKEPRVVGFNLVAPEDSPVAMENYSLHMRMIGELRKYFPSAKVSLHAGELRLGLVEPKGLRFHIREAVEIAKTHRIGHGVDLAFERDMQGLLKTMREQKTCVEICLSSNDQILGIKGAEHPVRVYMDAGIPVTLNTDDAGVARIDLTNEFQRAVQEQGFTYGDLVRAARNSLEYSFLSGKSLWQDSDTYTPVAACSDLSGNPSDACANFLARNKKASLQWKLEKQFQEFNTAVGIR